jgi:accessory gene regulator protein AgrB
MLPECLFFFLFFIPLRSFNGGLHLKSYLSCFIGSVIILVAVLLSVKYLFVQTPISFIAYLLTACFIIRLGPVNHPNRKVYSQENRLFIKRTYFTIFFSLITAFIFLFTSNEHYMLLQAITFFFVWVTAWLGRIIYPD